MSTRYKTIYFLLCTLFFSNHLSLGSLASAYESIRNNHYAFAERRMQLAAENLSAPRTVDTSSDTSFYTPNSSRMWLAFQNHSLRTHLHREPPSESFRSVVEQFSSIAIDLRQHNEMQRLSISFSEANSIPSTSQLNGTSHFLTSYPISSSTAEPHFSQKQIDEILGILASAKKTTPQLVDPQRDGGNFADIELGMASAILQICPHTTQSGYLAALRMVFSESRSTSLLNVIISGDNNEPQSNSN